MALKENDKAIDFILKRKTKDGLKEVKLSENFGRKNVVLLFFPFAFTGGCTDEMCGISKELDRYNDLNAVVYAISVDSPFAQEAWVKENSIKIPVLSDFNKEVAKKYGVLYEDFLGFMGVAKRSAFVINKDGAISYAWVTEDPKVLPDFGKIQSALEKL